MNKVNTLSNLLDWITKTEQNSVNAIRRLLSYTAEKYSPHKDDVIKEYDLTREERFNIFETISDQYQKEKFHSDVLYSILNPETPEIGTIYNKEILEKFVKMVDSSFEFIVDDTVKVSKEESNKVLNGDFEKQGYIDLLITNAHNQAIIIENKINNAPDMENQLVRYMKYVKEQVFGKDISFDNFKENVRVVYLTLVPGKIPNIYEYGDSFAEYKEMLSDAKSGTDGKILKYRSAVDSDKDKPDLVNFLTKCINLCKEKTDNKVLTKKVYLEQYKTLLGHLGGRVAMLEYQKKLLEHIYSSQEALAAARDLVNIKQTNSTSLEYQKDVLEEINSSPEKQKALNDLVEVFNSEEINTQYINDCLNKFFTKTDFKDFKFEDNWAYRVWNKDHTENLYVNGLWGFNIGFMATSFFKDGRKEQYKRILEDFFKDIQSADIIRFEDYWVCLLIKPLAGKSTMDEFLEYCTSFIPQVKKRFLENQGNTQ